MGKSPAAIFTLILHYPSSVLPSQVSAKHWTRMAMAMASTHRLGFIWSRGRRRIPRSQSPKKRKNVAKCPPNPTALSSPVSSWRPRHSPRSSVCVESAVHFGVNRWRVSLAGQSAAGESSDGEPTAGQPPDGQPHGFFVRNPICNPAGRRHALRRQLVAADRAGISHREPGDDAIGVVYVFTGHFSGLCSDFKRFFTHGAVWIQIHVTLRNLDRRHWFHGGFRRRRVFRSTKPVDFQLGQLLQQPIESGPHQKLRHGRRNRPETRPSTVVVVNIEAIPLTASAHIATVCGTTKNDNGVESRPIPKSPATPAGGQARRLKWILIQGVNRGRRESTVGIRRREGRGSFDCFDEAAVTVGASDGVLNPGTNEAVAAVTPIRRRSGRHRLRSDWNKKLERKQRKKRKKNVVVEMKEAKKGALRPIKWVQTRHAVSHERDHAPSAMHANELAGNVASSHWFRHWQCQWFPWTLNLRGPTQIPGAFRYG